MVQLVNIRPKQRLWAHQLRRTFGECYEEIHAHRKVRCGNDADSAPRHLVPKRLFVLLPSRCADDRIRPARGKLRQRCGDGLTHGEINGHVRRRPTVRSVRILSIHEPCDLHAILGRQRFDELPHPAMPDQQEPHAQLVTVSAWARSIRSRVEAG